MHILIALITAIGSLLWALSHFGVDIHSLNPFNWHRRNKWRKAYEAKPLHTLQKPIEAATVLLVALLTSEGLVSREQKEELIKVFITEFQQTEDNAANYFGSALFLLKDSLDIVPEIPHILAPSKDSFSDEQISSLLSLMKRIALFEGSISDKQNEIISAVENELTKNISKPGAW